VFFEEHPDSINDPAFFPPQRTSWIDLPGGSHDGAGGFSFADGHAELHHWRATARRVPVRLNLASFPRVRLNDPDVHWLSYHSQRVSEVSY
jgi:prepilin-type processing-associated H-X9-DG protein